jgi:hypothetical protein
MPNHIQNRLVVTANSNEELNAFLVAIKGDEKIDGEYPVIDFNKIIPMPMALRNTEASSRTDDAIYYYLAKTNQEEMISSILRHPKFYTMDRFADRNEKELNELLEIGKKYVEIFKECGAKDWYDWSICHWGTKWNAYETRLETLDEYSAVLLFQTAWSGVPNIIQKLTEMFPTIIFDYKYADEDMGYNCGEGYGEDGEFSFLMLQGGSEDAIRTYTECWDCDFDSFYQDDEGHWHNREWEDEEDEDYDEDDE